MFKKFPLLVYVPSKIVHDAILGFHASFPSIRPRLHVRETGTKTNSDRL